MATETGLCIRVGCVLPYNHPGACDLIFNRGGPVNPPQPVEPAIPPRRVERYPVAQCANLLCSNQAPEGVMVTVVIRDLRPGARRRDVALSLCAPCGEAVDRG